MGENGVYFDNALCPSPLCVPSRTCLASGREYDNCDIIDNMQIYPLHHQTFYSLLQEKAGYHTMMCGKFDLIKPFHAFDIDGRSDFDKYPVYNDFFSDKATELKEFAKGKDFLKEWGISDSIDNAGKMDGCRSFKEGRKGPYLHHLDRKGMAKLHIKDLKSRRYTGYGPCPLDQQDYVDDWITDQALKLMSRHLKGKILHSLFKLTSMGFIILGMLLKK